MNVYARNFCALLFCLALTMPAAYAQQAPQQPGAAAIAGFSNDHARQEREWEAKFRSAISPENLRSYMRRLSARPHHVGSPYDKDNAEWILSKFKEWGFDASIETFYVLFPDAQRAPAGDGSRLPGSPRSWRNRRWRSIRPRDKRSEQLPTYNAYSIDGDVTGPLVYVNEGLREDYETLDRLGISVKGAIVIVRYGDAWRGIKPKVAAEHGAIGCIIYSDPQRGWLL